MAITQADLGKLGVQAENEFLGSGTGPLYQLHGAIAVDYNRVMIRRETRVDVWRNAVSESAAGYSYEGTIEAELRFCRGFYTILNGLLTTKTTTLGSGVDTIVYRPWRAEDPASPSLRIAIEADGRWILFSGVLVIGIRVTARAQREVRVTVEWKAAQLTVVTSTPGWTFTQDATPGIAVSDYATLEVDSTEHEQALEASLKIEDPKEFSGLGDNGMFTSWTRDGVQQITGSVIEYEDTTHALSDKARDLTEAALLMTFAKQGDAAWALTASLPRAIFEEAEPEVFRASDSTVDTRFRVMQDSALNVSSEPTITFTTPEI